MKVILNKKEGETPSFTIIGNDNKIVGNIYLTQDVICDFQGLKKSKFIDFPAANNIILFDEEKYELSEKDRMDIRLECARIAGNSGMPRVAELYHFIVNGK